MTTGNQMPDEKAILWGQHYADTWPIHAFLTLSKVQVGSPTESRKHSLYDSTQ